MYCRLTDVFVLCLLFVSKYLNACIMSHGGSDLLSGIHLANDFGWLGGGALNTFLCGLHGRRWRSNFHGQAVGTSERMTVSNNKSSRVLILQHVDRYNEEENISGKNEKIAFQTCRCFYTIESFTMFLHFL